MSDVNDIDTTDLDEPAIAPPDDAPVGGPVADAADDDGPVYRRSINENTRKLFATAAKSIAEQIADGDGDDEEVAIPPPDEQPVAAAPAPASQGASPTAASPAAAAAAPAIDAAANRKGLELEVREQSITERETKLAEREKRAEALATARDRFTEKPFEAMRDLLKEWTGAATDEELRDEFADLITELSEKGLGMSVSSEVKSRTEGRRNVRIAKSYMDRAKRDAESAQKRAADERVEAEQKQRELMATGAIAEQLNKGKHADGKPHAERFAHLMLEDNPEGIVWDVIKTKASREPNWQPNWEEAALLADNHFKAQHEKQRSKLSRLPTPTAQAASSGASTQGAAQSRAARTLTNATATPVPPARPQGNEHVEDDEPYDKEKARRRSRGILRAEMEKRTT